MENNKPYYVTYKFYDEKGRRLSIFATPVFVVGKLEKELPTAANYLQVTIIPCSKKDTFSKKTGIGVFEEFKSLQRDAFLTNENVIELHVPIADGKPKTSFLRWCEANYFKLRPTIYVIETPVLWRGNELIKPKFKEFEVILLYEETQEENLEESKN